MKLSQDLYNSGSLRRLRLGPSSEWEYGNSDMPLLRSAVGALFRRVRGLLAAQPRRSGAAPRLECLRSQKLRRSDARVAASIHPWKARQ